MMSYWPHNNLSAKKLGDGPFVSSVNSAILISFVVSKEGIEDRNRAIEQL